jgi:hypothetical protein
MWLLKACRQFAWTVALVSLIGSTPSQAQSLDLPAGPVQDKVRTACTECHDSRIIQQQRLGSKAWTKEVDKMIKWGAVVDLADRNAFIDYLSTNFPPDKAVEPGERITTGKKNK